MKYQVEVAGSVFEVTIQQTATSLTAVIDGLPVSMDARTAGGELSLKLAERSFRIRTEHGLREDVAWVEGYLLRGTVKSERELLAAQVGDGAAAAATTLTSLIPGRIVEVRVKIGDRVEAGQTVAIIEAMKMENEISAEFAGLVTAVHVKAGGTVGAGEPLIELGAAPG